MKYGIKSKTEVITNSSTEVFILETNKSLSDVSKILHEITSGFREPEVMKKYVGVLEDLKEFGYLFDPDEKESMEYFYLDRLGSDSYFNEETLEDVIIPGAKELKDLWEEHLWENREVLNKFYKESRPNSERVFIPEDRDELRWLYLRSPYQLPENFIEDFINSLPSFPSRLILPKELDVNTYIGKIGFKGEEDNSIPYETWDKIINIFGGIRWHMG